MKKVFFLFLMAAGLSVTSFAQGHHDDHHAGNQRYKANQYYYYPEANVYYHPSTSSYAYYDQNGWRTARNLPRNYRHNSSMRYVPVNYQGNAVWNDNSHHRSQYNGYNNVAAPHSDNVSRKEHKREHQRQQQGYYDRY